REMVALQAEPTPAQAVVESLPGRLAAQHGLDGDAARPVVTEYVLAPAEERHGVVVGRVQGDGLDEQVAGAPVVASVVELLALRERRLDPDSATQVLERACRRHRGDLDRQPERDQRQ